MKVKLIFDHEKVEKCNCGYAFKSDAEKYASKCYYCNNTGVVIDPTTVLCNNCGDSMCVNERDIYGMHDLSYDGGYDSQHLSDMTNYRFKLCEKCLRSMFEKFKIKPLVYSFGSKISYEEESFFNKRAIWRASPKFELAAKNGKCNFTPNCKNKAFYSISEKTSGYSHETCCKSCFKKEHLVNLFGIKNKVYPYVPYALRAFD